MECDDDQGIGESNKSFNSNDVIVKEARAVYNQLKMLHFTLKGNHDGDSGTFLSLTIIRLSRNFIVRLSICLLGLHSDLFLGSSDQLSSSPQYESNEELHQGMLSALADDIINLVMSLDVVHFKTMLDKSRTTNQEQDEELRRRQELIMDLECKVCVWPLARQHHSIENDEIRF